MRITLTLTPGSKASHTLQPVEIDDADFEALFTTYDVRDNKDGQAVILARFQPCPSGACRSGRATSCKGGQDHRLNANVVAVTGLGVDIDDVTNEHGGQILQQLEARGIETGFFQTYSHDADAAERGEAKGRFRLVFRFKEEMPITNPKQWTRNAWPKLIKYLGLEGLPGVAACSDPSRLFYTPSKPTEGAVREAAILPGKPLDWRAVVGDLDDIPAEPTQHGARQDEDPTRPVDLGALREDLQRSARKNENTTLRRVLTGEAVSKPKGERQQGDRSRYEAWRAATIGVANVAADWMSTDALMEVFIPSHDQEARETPDDYTDLDTVRGLFERARDKVAGERAIRRADHQRFLTRISGLTKRTRAPRAAEFESEEDAPVEDAEPEEAAVDQWVLSLETKEEKTGDVTILPTLTNLQTIFENDAQLSGIRLNTFSGGLETEGEVLNNEPGIHAYEDNHVVRVRHYLYEMYRLKYSKEDVYDYLVKTASARGRAYDQLQDFLTGLKWDGVKRVERLFEEYMKSSDADAEYRATLAIRWMVSLVARGMEPGCKSDSILHLEGRQGIGKSSALEVFGCGVPGFYKNFDVNFDDKDTWMECGRSWILELGELEALKKSDVRMQKNFLSRREDSFRPPYGRAALTRPRRCVFVGTTNEESYLSDVTGNRRHWTLLLDSVDLEALRRDCLQLLAEAVELYRSGVQWHMTTDEAAVTEMRAASRVKDDPVGEKIVSWLFSKEPAQRPRSVTTAQIIESALGLDVGRSLESRVGPALKTLGFRRERRVVNGLRTYVYVTPETVLTAPKAHTSQDDVSERIAAAVVKAQA